MNSFNLSDAAPISPQMWMVYAVAFLTIIYAVFLRPKMQKNKDPLSRPSSLARQRTVEKQMETLLVELSAMARQITAQLDTRAAKLETLIQEADRKIAALRSPPSPMEPDHPAAAGRDMPVIEDSRHAAVYELADVGLSAGQIAQRLNRPSGEIELILALRPKK
jgi:hypothetical protein